MNLKPGDLLCLRQDIHSGTILWNSPVPFQREKITFIGSWEIALFIHDHPHTPSNPPYLLVITSRGCLGWVNAERITLVEP